MANAAHNAPKLQIGKLTPEDAERLASSFRPIWDLDDAPFAQGSALSAADVDALSAGAGVAPSVRAAQQLAPEPVTLASSEVHSAITEVQPAPRGSVPAPNAPKVEVSIEMDIEPDPTPPPVQQPVVAQARAQSARSKSPTVRVPSPRTPPTPIKPMGKMDVGGSGEYAPVKKSSTGLVVAVVGVIVVVGGIFGVRAMMSGDKPTSKSNASDTSTSHEEGTHIPPPPPEVAATQTAATTQTAAPIATVAKTSDTTPITTVFPGTTSAPSTTHQSTASNVTAPIHTAASNGGGGHTATAATAHTAASGGGAKTGGGSHAIVRDNPF